MIHKPRTGYEPCNMFRLQKGTPYLLSNGFSRFSLVFGNSWIRSFSYIYIVFVFLTSLNFQHHCQKLITWCSLICRCITPFETGPTGPPWTSVDPGSALNEEMAKWTDEEISQCWASTQGVIRALHRGPVFSEATRVEDRVRWDVYIYVFIYI